jgi:hypothetical protein
MDRSLLRRALRFCAVTYLVARIALSLLGLLVGSIDANEPPGDPPTLRPVVSAGMHNLFDGTLRLDAAWFVTIADDGYDVDPNSAAFFPAYPMLIRAVSFLPWMSSLTAAILVSNLALFGALVALYVLTTHELTEAVAKRTVVLLMAFPTSFFLLAPYSESLFLLLAIIALGAARRRRWVTGALAGALAALTRFIGIALIPALAVEAWTSRDRRERTRGVVAACAIALGPLAYFAWWQYHADDMLAPIHAQRHWNRTFQIPIATLARGLYLGWDALGAPDAGYWVSDAILTIAVIVGLIVIARRVPLSYLAYGVGNLLVPLSYPYLGRDLLAISRFALVIFPAFWGMSVLTERRAVFAIWLAVSVPLAAWHAVLFMHYRHIY